MGAPPPPQKKGKREGKKQIVPKIFPPRQWGQNFLFGPKKKERGKNKVFFLKQMDQTKDWKKLKNFFFWKRFVKGVKNNH